MSHGLKIITFVDEFKFLEYMIKREVLVNFVRKEYNFEPYSGVLSNQRQFWLVIY